MLESRSQSAAWKGGGRQNCLPHQAAEPQRPHDCFSLFVNEQAKAYSTKKRHENSLHGAMNCSECNTKRQGRKGSMTALAYLLTNKLKHIPQKSGMKILCTVR
jgi:hypothetical protein